MFLPLIFFRLNLIKRSLKAVISRKTSARNTFIMGPKHEYWEKDVQIEFGNRKGGF